MGYLIQLRPTEAYSLTLIYRDESANTLVSLLRYPHPSTTKPLDN